MGEHLTKRSDWKEVHTFLKVFRVPRNLPHFNIAPTEPADGVQAGPKGRKLVSMRWKKSTKELPFTFNARAESGIEQPIFRNAFRERRCIISASGVHE